MSQRKDEIRVLVENRRVRHEYVLEETWEAGIALVGSEVKSLRAGQGNLAEAWVRIAPDGAWLMQCHIAPYAQANRQNHEPVRPRRLLLHDHELNKLWKATKQGGMTVVPVRLYLKGSLIKIEIALARGKKLHDKRESIKERDAKREMARSRR